MRELAKVYVGECRIQRCNNFLIGVNSGCKSNNDSCNECDLLKSVTCSNTICEKCKAKLWREKVAFICPFTQVKEIQGISCPFPSGPGCRIPGEKSDCDKYLQLENQIKTNFKLSLG